MEDRAEAKGTQKYIVCNADEGDSGTFADRMLMEGDPFTLIEGMAIAGLATGATKGFCLIRSEYPDAIRIMQDAVRIALAEGVLGASVLNSGRAFDIEIRVGAGAYVCGEETSLLNSLEGKRGIVRASRRYPRFQGFLGRPTVVNNVISLASVPVILEKGAAHYKGFGLGRSRGTIPLADRGQREARRALRNRLWPDPWRHRRQDRRRHRLGPSGQGRAGRRGRSGLLPRALFDTPFGYEEFPQARTVLWGHAGIVVFDDTADMLKQHVSRLNSAPSNPAANAPPAASVPCAGVETVDRIAAGDPAAPAILTDLCNTMKLGFALRAWRLHTLSGDVGADAFPR